MAAPYSQLRSKINRAIAGYLIGLANSAVGTLGNIQPENDTVSNTFPNTTIHALVGKPDSKMTGNIRIPIRISIKGSCIDAVGTTEYQKARKLFDARVGATVDALMLSDNDQNLKRTAFLVTQAGRALATNVNPDIAAANADMLDFTITQWYDAGMGDGEPNEEGSNWEEIYLFECVACASNVD